MFLTRRIVIEEKTESFVISTELLEYDKYYNLLYLYQYRDEYVYEFKQEL